MPFLFWNGCFFLIVNGLNDSSDSYDNPQDQIQDAEHCEDCSNVNLLGMDENVQYCAEENREDHDRDQAYEEKARWFKRDFFYQSFLKPPRWDFKEQEGCDWYEKI
jgi:hypothetical protein